MDAPDGIRMRMLWGSTGNGLPSYEKQLQCNEKSMKSSWEISGETIGNSLETATGLQMDGKWKRRIENEWKTFCDAIEDQSAID